VKKYWTESRKISYGIILGAILFALYEGLRWLLFSGSGMDNGAAVWLKTLIFAFPNGPIYAAVVALAVSAYFGVRDYQSGLRLRFDYLAYSVWESFFWALAVFVGLGYLAPLIVSPSMSAGHDTRNWLGDMVMSLGAGFYEELFFRLGLVSLFQGAFMFVGRDPDRPGNVVLIVLATATLFSLAHFKFVIGEYGDDFSFYKFFFRTFFGVCMSAMMVSRGFGITAWTHAWYDVVVFSVRAL
jgi:hypothetical protein